MTEILKGNPVSIAWDKIDGEDWIVIRDSELKTIMTVQKSLWDDKIAGFSPELRDSILDCCRRMHG